MATRRPKVPRADALGRPNSAGRPNSSGRPNSAGRLNGAGTANGPARPATAGKPNSAGHADGDVIEAEFGASRAPAESSTPATAARKTRAPKTPGSGRSPATKTTGSGKSPATRTSPAASTKASSKASGNSAGDAQDLDPVPAKAFSGRMLALAVVMIAITIMLAPTVRIFLEKRAEISALEAEIASKQAEQAELNKQLSRWQDPNYVKQQARDRINMVMPGETGYWVFGGEEAAGTPGGRTGSGSSANPANLPWVDALWESIRRSATD
ncbi:septum formation initiator family protein [Arthrobacter sp. 1088]|uniref:FtsB family cell division protein n=1 Tax=Arthrobacter sp. 1088 TaxID=2817768 RepID=UPI00286B5423|nr:septum formation initiator family protein [Arthrobacter sp. 1088]